MHPFGLSYLLPLHVILSFLFPPSNALPGFHSAASDRKLGHSSTTALSLTPCVPDDTLPAFDDITPELLYRMKLMSQYAAASYCPANTDSPGTLITCSDELCPLVEAAHAKTVAEFQNMGTSDGTGFIAIDDMNERVIVVFRGSRSLPNWYQNFKVWKVSTGWCPECNVHKGFWDSWVQAREEVIKVLKQAVRSRPGYRLAIAGHSLGGAVSTLAAGEIRQINDYFCQNTELYAFGSPRVGNENMVKYLSAQSRFSYRVTSMNDPVTRIPPTTMGYVHTIPEYWIHDHPTDPTAEDISILYEYDSDKGNAGQAFTKDGRPHRYYFGYINKCFPVWDKSWRRDLGLSLSNSSPSVEQHLQGLEWDILRPYINTSMVTMHTVRDPNDEPCTEIVFPPGSVSETAAEAVYGPAASNGTSLVPLHR